MYRQTMIPTCAILMLMTGTIAMSHAQRKTTDKKPGTRDLVVTRTFDASLEQVWKAWTDSEQVKRWWGPTGFTCPVAKMDVRKGGVSLVCMRAPKEFGGQEMYSTWAYQVVEPMKRIEYIHNLADKDGKTIDPATLGLTPDFPRNQRHVVTFKSLDEKKTEMTMTEYGYTSEKWFELSKLGLGQCLDKMAASFAKP